MARTFSTMLPLGTSLPPFELAVVKGTGLIYETAYKTLDKISSNALEGRPVLLMMICAHCPFVKHIESELTNLDQDYGDRVQMLAIASNSMATHPQDCPENLALQAKTRGWKFPYLLDLDQSFAKALKAACTPDFFLFSHFGDGHQKLRYRGQLDGSSPGNDVPLTGRDLRSALDAVLQGGEVCFDQKPSIGCNIKWHPGKEPSWFS